MVNNDLRCMEQGTGYGNGRVGIRAAGLGIRVMPNQAASNTRTDKTCVRVNRQNLSGSTDKTCQGQPTKPVRVNRQNLSGSTDKTCQGQPTTVSNTRTDKTCVRVDLNDC